MEEENVFKYDRKSHIEINSIYFWTVTINSWQKLLLDDSFKNVIISSLKYLSDLDKLDVFAFVIMPNHFHAIIRTKSLNGKESVQGSFLKFTAHEFKKLLVSNDLQKLSKFRVDASNKKYEFWKRDSLAIKLFSKENAFQKLDYIHNNPLKEHWSLVTKPEDYFYSSASFYEEGDLYFDFLKDLRAEF
jgi:REP element-mobilizing transposase RayT